MIAQRTKLPNGLDVVSLNMPSAHSVAMGVWVRAGARDETDEESGIAHFLEHMAFKGTTARSAAQIAVDIENVGGFINAYTSREETAYFVRLLPEKVELGAEILADILLDSQLPEKEIERERGVIIQEIGQSADTPDDQVFEHFNRASFGSHVLGRSILGTTQSVSLFSRDDLSQFMHRYYGAEQMLFCAAGAIDHDRLVQLAQHYLGRLGSAESPVRTAPEWQAGSTIEERDLEQSHIVFGLPAPKAVSDDRYALFILSNLYGGGMSSRLFQQVREERGLCYSIFSFAQLLSDNGVFGVYAGTSAEQLNEMLDVCAGALQDCSQNITDDEIARSKQQLKASVLMRRDSVQGMLDTTARQIILFDEIQDKDQLIRDIDAVSREQVMAMAETLLRSAEPSLSLVGPATGFKGQDWLAGRLQG